MSSFGISQNFLNQSISKKTGRVNKNKEENIFELAENESSSSSSSSSSPSSSEIKNSHRGNHRLAAVKLQKGVIKTSDHF
jgi:hypothetical protein